MFEEYPKWKYSTTGGVIVDHAEEEEALGDGWFNYPDEVVHDAEYKAESNKLLAEQEGKDLDTLRATATDLGISVDGRWKAPRLEEEIKAKILANGKEA